MERRIDKKNPQFLLFLKIFLKLRTTVLAESFCSFSPIWRRNFAKIAHFRAKFRPFFASFWPKFDSFLTPSTLFIAFLSDNVKIFNKLWFFFGKLIWNLLSKYYLVKLSVVGVKKITSIFMSFLSVLEGVPEKIE